MQPPRRKLQPVEDNRIDGHGAELRRAGVTGQFLSAIVIIPKIRKIYLGLSIFPNE